MAAVEADTNNNAYSEEKTLKIQSDIFDNIKVDELIRGVSPTNIETRCLDLCQQFIGGSWEKATIKDIIVTRISGGLTNQLWHVKLDDDFPRVPNQVYSDEPSEVAIKLFQEKHMKNYHLDDQERLNDIIILTAMAETGLGPKIYGIFADGFIQAYHKHEQFRARHQNDPKLLDEMIGILAKIHQMKIPIRKKKNLLLEDVGRMIETSYARGPIEEICKEAGYKNMNERNLIDEWKTVERIIKKLNAPTVFCHCDFRGSNLLVTDNGILAIDLEYSNYGCRPYDISTILNEWGKTDLLDRSMGKIPSDEVVKKFINMYIQHNERLQPGYASKPENQVDVIYREVRVFFLVIYMFFLSIMVKSEESIIPNVPFDRKQFLGYCDQVYGFYRQIKQDLFKEGLIDEEDL